MDERMTDIWSEEDLSYLQKSAEEWKRSSEPLAPYFRRAVEAVLAREGMAMSAEDAVSVAQLAAMEAVSYLAGGEGGVLSDEALDTYLAEKLDAAEEELSQAYYTDEALVMRVQSLSDAIDRLTAANAEKPNIDELANELGISQDEVLSVIRLTGEDTENTEVPSSGEGGEA